MLLLLMYKMVLEIELQHAEGIHTLARTQIPEFFDHEVRNTAKLNGCPMRSTETRSGLHCNQVARG